MQHGRESSDFMGSNTPNVTSMRGSNEHSPVSPTSTRKIEDNPFISVLDGSPDMPSEFGSSASSSSTRSADSRSGNVRPSRTYQTRKTNRSTRSSQTSIGAVAFKRRLRENLDELREQSPMSQARSGPNSSRARQSIFSGTSEFRHATSSFTQSPRSTLSQRKRLVEAWPPSKRRKPNGQTARDESEPSMKGYTTRRAPYSLGRSLSWGSPCPVQNSDRRGETKNHGLDILHLKFSVQDRDLLGKPRTEVYGLDLDVNQVKDWLILYDRFSKGFCSESDHSAFTEWQLDKQRYPHPPEAYLRPAFAALCELASDLKSRNEELVDERALLQDQIDSLEFGPQTPDSFDGSDENSMVQRLLNTIQDLKTEIALLKLTQHDAPSSPHVINSHFQNQQAHRDSYLQFLPAHEPGQQNSHRVSIVLNECREEEREKYERRLGRVRQGIFERQQKLDALTSQHEQDLGELQQQLNFQQDEKTSMLERIRWLADTHDDQNVLIEEYAREHKHLQQKYSALELEYVKVKEQRDGALKIGRLAKERLGNLIVDQATSQLTLQRNFEWMRLGAHGGPDQSHQQSVSTSIASDDTMTNLRQRVDTEQNIPAATPSNASYRSVRKARPAPIQLGHPSKGLPKVDRSRPTLLDSPIAQQVLDPAEIVENLPPGSPGENAWKEALETSQHEDIHGLTPLFRTEPFVHWRWQVKQRAKINFDITSMDADHYLYTFRENEIVHVFPGLGVFWPVQIDGDDSNRVFAVPCNALELVCSHGHPYRKRYMVDSPWMPDLPADTECVILRPEVKIVHCAHIKLIESQGEVEAYGCLLVRDGYRGYAPMSCLTPEAQHHSTNSSSRCPCPSSQIYSRRGAIMRDCESGPEGTKFKAGDQVKIAHFTPEGNFCVRLEKNGATGFVYATDLRILESPSELVWDTRWDRNLDPEKREVNLDASMEANLPLPHSPQKVWNDNLMGNNPRYRKLSQIEKKRDERRYAPWKEGPPLGEYYIETADFRKLPPVWKDVLTINPLDANKGPRRARAKSMIARERMSKYHVKHGLHIGLELKTTIADGEIAYKLDDGIEEDRGYMSDPATQEERSRRLHYVFEQDESPIDVDADLAEEYEEVSGLVRGHAEGTFLNLNHRRPGFLINEGLGWLANYILQRKNDKLIRKIAELEQEKSLLTEKNASLDVRNGDLEKRIGELDVDHRASLGAETDEEAKHTPLKIPLPLGTHGNLGKTHNARSNGMKGKNSVRLPRIRSIRPRSPPSLVKKADERKIVPRNQVLPRWLDEEKELKSVGQKQLVPYSPARKESFGLQSALQKETIPSWLENNEEPPLWLIYWAIQMYSIMSDIWQRQLAIYLLQIAPYTPTKTAAKNRIYMNDIADVTWRTPLGKHQSLRSSKLLPSSEKPLITNGTEQKRRVGADHEDDRLNAEHKALEQSKSQLGPSTQEEAVLGDTVRQAPIRADDKGRKPSTHSEHQLSSLSLENKLPKSSEKPKYPAFQKVKRQLSTTTTQKAEIGVFLILLSIAWPSLQNILFS